MATYKTLRVIGKPDVVEFSILDGYVLIKKAFLQHGKEIVYHISVSLDDFSDVIDFVKQETVKNG